MKEDEIKPLKDKLNETADMFLLADIYLHIGLLLESNDFPMESYKIYKDKK